LGCYPIEALSTLRSFAIQVGEATEHVAVAGDQFTFAVLDVRERAEPVHLLFAKYLDGLSVNRTSDLVDSL
jgi:hypothetical protein